MAVTCGFYNGLSGDRVYDATQMSEIFNGIITDGVLATVPGHLAVTVNNLLTVQVAPGRAWFNGTWTKNDAYYDITLEAASSSYDRLDIIALEVDTSPGVRTNRLMYIKGSAVAGKPIPALGNTATKFRYPLAYVTVPKSATQLFGNNIENRIGFAPTPWCTAPLNSVSTESMINEWYTDFDLWFDNVKAILSGDAAGALATRLTALERGPVVYKRAGNATDTANWESGGTTVYSPGSATRMQVGSLTVGNTASINFPEAFSGNPLVFLTCYSAVPGSTYVLTANVVSVSPSGFTVKVTEHTTVAPYHKNGWGFLFSQAIGPI
jgi:hypothetical protein